MKYLLPALTLSVCLLGFGCFEQALEYPKTFDIDNQKSIESTISLTGIIRSLDATTGQMELETSAGFVEEIIITAEAAISLNADEDKKFSDLSVNSVAEIFGTRDPATLITTARTVRAEDLTPIKIVTPVSGATVNSPLIVNGFIKATNQKIYWRIKDQNNATQMSGSNSISGEEQKYNPFRLEIYLPALEANNFTLEVFASVWPPTKQLIEIGLVSLPLNLLSTNKSELKIFFVKGNGSCTEVSPVIRTVAETSATGRAAIIELLNGPNSNERIQGYRSSIPVDTIITAFIISGDTATVTVSKNFDRLSVCEKQRATEQIKQTLLQIGLVNNVEIKVE